MKSLVRILLLAMTGLFSVAVVRIWNKVFSNKKTLITGPISSGKTTFLRYISKKEIPEGPSGSPKRYEVEDATFDEVTDLSGDQAWLGGRFDEYIKEHDYILFFFDVSKYLESSEREYKSDVNARIDMINRYYIPSKTKVLLVGTHVDKVPGFRPSDLENMFADKPYRCLLDRIVYIDTTQKECVETILNVLNK